MKWFKHDTDGYRSEGLAAIRAEFGFEGVGWWYTILEMIAEKMDGSDKCSIELPLQNWCRTLETKPKKFRSYLILLSQKCKTSSSETEQNGITYVSVSIPNLLKKRDEHTTRLGSKFGAKPVQEGEGEGEGDKDSEKEITKTSKVPMGSKVTRASARPSSFEKSFPNPNQNSELIEQLLRVTGAESYQDKTDLVFDALQAIKQGNIQQIHNLISEIKAGEHHKTRNLIALARAKLRCYAT